MQRAVLITFVVFCLGLAAKLALKPPAIYRADAPVGTNPVTHEGRPSSARPVTAERRAVEAGQNDFAENNDHAILDRYPDHRELVLNLLKTFGHNARQIEAVSGLAGLLLLDQLGDAGVCLFEERPADFQKLASSTAADPNATALVGAWRRFFDPQETDNATTALLAAELAKLPPRARRIAQTTPEALPFLLVDSKRVCRAIDRFGPDALEALAYVDLADGGESLRIATTLLDRFGQLTMDATDCIGPAGLVLIELFGPLVESIRPALGLSRALAVVAISHEDLDDLVAKYRVRTVADTMLHLDEHKLLDIAVRSPDGLRMAIEYGSQGEQLLKLTGAAGVHIAYRLYEDERCRNAVVRAIAQGGLPAAIAAKRYAGSPDFQRITAREGPGAVLAVAAACSAEEARTFLAEKPERTWTESLALGTLRMAGDSSAKTIRIIDRDGLERIEELADTNVRLRHFLPLYDLSRLAGVVGNGYVPTRGELVWAGVDAALVAIDVVSLMALQPEGVAASEAARAGVKSTVRAGTRSGVQTAAGHASGKVAQQAAREAARRTLQQSSEQAAESVVKTAAGHELIESLLRQSALRLATGSGAAIRRPLLNALASVPPRRLTKYVLVNGGQAAVGLAAVQKMNEYITGRQLKTEN